MCSIVLKKSAKFFLIWFIIFIAKNLISYSLFQLLTPRLEQSVGEWSACLCGDPVYLIQSQTNADSTNF